MGFDLEQELSEYGEIIEKLEYFMTQKKIKKEKFKEFLRNQEFITESDAEVKFDSRDSDGNVWRITNTETSRTTTDWNYLESILTEDQLVKAKKVKSGERFSVSRVKLKGEKNDAKVAVPIINT